MENKFKDNPLACLLLGIIIGGGGTLGGQALVNGASNQAGTVSSFYEAGSGTKTSNNFERISYSAGGNVYITPSGKKYHYVGCPVLKRAKNLRQVTQEDAETAGLTPCSKCD